MTITTLKLAESIAGSLGKPSKMPGHAYGISAHGCHVGAKLALVKGSVCFDCYAKKGQYGAPSVKKGHAKREAGLYHPQWVDAMVFMIKRTGDKYFRFHDSGDIRSMQHLLNIVRVCESLPSVSFWLPTKEKKTVNDYLDTFGAFPANLTVRLSAAMVDADAPLFANTSTVTTDPSKATCTAPSNNGKCGECRQCWDSTVKNVSYLKH